MYRRDTTSNGDDESSGERDDADRSATPENYYFAGGNGDAWTDKTFHIDPQCQALVRAPGGEKPILAGTIDEAEQDYSWCARCAPQRAGYAAADPAVVEVVEDGTAYQLRLPSGVHVRIEYVRAHDAGFYELIAGRHIVGTVGGDEVNDWPESARETFLSIDGPPKRKVPGGGPV